MTKAESLDLSERQRAILDLVVERGFVTIDGLAGIFGVSAQTVRREIIAMNASGLLQRFHGGAGLPAGMDALRLGHGYKSGRARSEKIAIAERVSKLIQPGSSVFVDIGTTMETAAEALNRLDGLVVFTNSMKVAALFDFKRHAVNVLGGERAGSDGSLVGEAAVSALWDLRLDHALVSCTGIEADGSVMDFDRRKIAVKSAALAAASVTSLLATREKFGRSAFARIGHLDDFDHVITGQENRAPAEEAHSSNRN
jgi:DeoR family glycerol-3-phosphate regulon repressor